jgi:hypothetical protein
MSSPPLRAHSTSYCTTIYHELTTTTIVSEGIRRTIRASESPQSGYILGSSGPARTDRCGCKVLLISRFQVRVLGGSLPFSLQIVEKLRSSSFTLELFDASLTLTDSSLLGELADIDSRVRSELAGQPRPSTPLCSETWYSSSVCGPSHRSLHLQTLVYPSSRVKCNTTRLLTRLRLLIVVRHPRRST